jgi:hypothetical protein
VLPPRADYRHTMTPTSQVCVRSWLSKRARLDHFQNEVPNCPGTPRKLSRTGAHDARP